MDPVFCTRDRSALREIIKRYRVRESYSELGELVRSRPAADMVHAATDGHLKTV